MPQNLYKYMYDAVKAGTCYECSGVGKHPETDDFHEHPCTHCKGTGKPTEGDLDRAKLYERRICAICHLPMVDGYDPAPRMGPNEGNDCLAHALQRISVLEERIDVLAQKRAARLGGKTCWCELRNRQWNPNTGRCDYCGFTYQAGR